MSKEYFIAWWNLENLFDVWNSKLRPEWLAKELKSELKGWTKTVLAKKIFNLSSIIKKMNLGKGPDLLGVCEVENENVMKMLADSLNLPGRNYKVIHKDTKDKRGIDIAFIYDENLFSFDGSIFSYEVLKRTATRDLVQVSMKTKSGNEFIVIGNHWPARSEGQYESEPYRMMVGETLSYWMHRIFEIRSDKIPVLVMGDFNDEPYNRSLTEYALATQNKDKTLRGRNPYLWNVSWSLLEESGTYFFGSDKLTLDQIMVTKGFFIDESKLKIDASSLRVESYKGLTDKNGKAIRYSRPSEGNEFNQNGFSDHLPVSVKIIES